MVGSVAHGRGQGQWGLGTKENRHPHSNICSKARKIFGLLYQRFYNDVNSGILLTTYGNQVLGLWPPGPSIDG